MKQKFYTCGHCGTVIAMVRDSGAPVICCGERMQELTPGATGASQEKHTPVYQTEGSKVTVTVGSVEHPMSPEHYIEWVCLETKQGGQYKRLKPNTPPRACFSLCEGDKVEAAYAFCNLHSLWKS